MICLLKNGWIFEAIFNFNYANTDSDATSTQAEAVFMISCFERLLGISGNENKLANLFIEQFSPDTDITPELCPRLNNPTLLRRFSNSVTIRDMWFRDFFRLRGEVAHGKIDSKYSSVWSLDDHLLLASFAFPLLLKYLLEKSGYYKLTWTDKVFINVFEKLTFEEHIVVRDAEDEEKEWPWNRIINDALFEYAFMKQH